jgi:hypothetical protein
MKITRNVILDLLPLYLADEVSTDTRLLVDNYLETDPELALLAQERLPTMNLSGDIPVPLTEDDKMKAYRKTRWLMALYIIILALIGSLILGAALFMFLVSS